MKVAVCFLAIACSAVGLPAEDPFQTLDELDLSQLTSNDVFVEPVQPAKPVDLPGSRIVGGAEVAPHAAPYQAAIIIDGVSFCGGSLITTNRVLTAAHCTISASFVQVRLGAHLFAEDEATQVRITSSSIVIHEYYNSNSLAYDVSVIFLPTQVTLNDYVKVVALAPAQGDSYAGSWGFLTGWGPTTDCHSSVAVAALRGVYVQVISMFECSQIYGNAIRASNLCTSGEGMVGACSGDSGGPLVVAGVQVGITAFYSIWSGYPTGFTRITEVRSWIDQYL